MKKMEKLEKIIIGDDHPELIKKFLPEGLELEMYIANDPLAFYMRVTVDELAGRPYTLVISDYDYGKGRVTGIDVFRELLEKGFCKDYKSFTTSIRITRQPVLKGHL